jgi:hypothetical protein
VGLFQKSIEAIIAQGVQDLEYTQKSIQQASDEAKVKVSQCQSEIQALVTLSKQVPDKVFDRYSNVLVGTIEQYVEPSELYATMRLASGETQLRGLMGNEKIPKGKYRVIVLLEPIS